MKRSAFGVWRLAFGADDIDIDTSLKQVTCKRSFSLRPSGAPSRQTANAERQTATANPHATGRRYQTSGEKRGAKNNVWQPAGSQPRRSEPDLTFSTRESRLPGNPENSLLPNAFDRSE